MAEQGEIEQVQPAVVERDMGGDPPVSDPASSSPTNDAVNDEVSTAPKEPSTADRLRDKYFSDKVSEQTSEVEALKAELEKLKSSINTNAASSPQPTVSSPKEEDFIEIIKTRGVKEGQKFLIEQAEKSILAKMEEREATLKETLANRFIELNRADQTLTRLNEGIFNSPDNSDVVEFRAEIERSVQDRVQSAKTAGRIKSINELLEAAKIATEEEVKRYKSIVSKLRGQGAEGATTKRAEVVSSTPIASNPSMAGSRGESTKSDDSPKDMESVNDNWMDRRAFASRRLRGLEA